MGRCFGPVSMRLWDRHSRMYRGGLNFSEGQMAVGVGEVGRAGGQDGLETGIEM